MDGAKRSEAEGWFPQCHLSMFCSAAFCSFVLHCPSYLYSCSCLAEEKRDEEKLVFQQEAVPQEKPRRRRKRRLPPAMRVHALLLKFFYYVEYLLWFLLNHVMFSYFRTDVHRLYFIWFDSRCTFPRLRSSILLNLSLEM